ncbi:ornithine decarboxylase 1-like [Scyliorhinus torazame]|uniref:ornithine decarboxylase 1-like n=1 Tax=Scyliorhinus torazame TaxID=75743 RepID=UPI003B592227
MESWIAGSEIVILEEDITVGNVIDQKINEQMDRDLTDAFIIVDLGALVDQHLRWQRALPRVEPFYAVKCNSSKPVVQILAQMGMGFDCASKNEIALIRDIGVAGERIVYANPCKESSHIKYAASRGVQLLTFDNEDELHKVAMNHPAAKLVLRIATNYSATQISLSEKFGATISECGHLMECAAALKLDIIGVSFHIGSGCTELEHFTRAIADARIVFDMGIHLGFHMGVLDIGGGFPGSRNEKVIFEELTAVINPALDIYFPEGNGVKIIAEPGRYYVTSSFTLAVNIIARRIITNSQSSSNDEAENNKTIMYYINDGLYGSFDNVSQFRDLLKPILYKKDIPDQKLYRTMVWGPTCDAFDYITDIWKLPELKIGNWLLLQNMGAYTVSTLTTFNGFDGPTADYVISKKAWETVQKIKKGTESPE